MPIDLDQLLEFILAIMEACNAENAYQRIRRGGIDVRWYVRRGVLDQAPTLRGPQLWSTVSGVMTEIAAVPDGELRAFCDDVCKG